jgi:protein involved in ribonucleotide reduction
MALTTAMTGITHHGTDGELTAMTASPSVVYFSSVSENTKRFVDRLGLPSQRIPLRPADPHLQVARPYVLIVPTYGGGNGAGAVPKQVIRFLNDTHNRSLLRGVVAAGNTNFGAAYCIAGTIIAAKCGVPHLYNFELLGTTEDVHNVREGMERLWLQH